MALQDHKNYEALVAYFRNGGLFTNEGDASKKVLLTLYRVLARGKPVEVDDLASYSEVEISVVESVLKNVSPSNIVYDNSGAITGYRGLSLNESPHQVCVNGLCLFAWCAFDCLFLPELLGSAIGITSKCSETGQVIDLTVSPQIIMSKQPDDIVVSFVMPDLTSYTNDLRGKFCNHVNFFSSRDRGLDWIRRNQEVILIDLEEAFSLAHIRNITQFGKILNTGKNPSQFTCVT